MRRKGLKEQGFTLLEIIASLAILGIILGYLLYIQEESQDLALENHDARIARLLAKKKLEEILLEGLQKIGQEGSFKDQPGIRWQVLVTPVQPIEGFMVDEITLIVTYGRDGKKSYRLKVWRKSQKSQQNLNQPNPIGK
ncbi:MAG: type II secretion system protein [Planctomycetota bacterium]|nr:MAG: type II secretion system protein [Planctomycetota bacterium]